MISATSFARSLSPTTPVAFDAAADRQRSQSHHRSHSPPRPSFSNRLLFLPPPPPLEVAAFSSWRRLSCVAALLFFFFVIRALSFLEALAFKEFIIIKFFF